MRFLSKNLLMDFALWYCVRSCLNTFGPSLSHHTELRHLTKRKQKKTLKLMFSLIIWFGIAIELLENDSCKEKEIKIGYWNMHIDLSLRLMSFGVINLKNLEIKIIEKMIRIRRR